MSITSVKINNYVTPFQQVLEGLPAISNYYGYHPLKSGSRVPYFHHPITQIIQPEKNSRIKFLINDHATSHELLNIRKPVVLAFRPVFNNDADIQRLFLETLQADIRVMGGDLIVVSNASVRAFMRNLTGANHLHIFSDTDNKIAELFGLYNADNPVTDWLSGIEGDISLPAFYIINPGGKIVYHYIDYNFRTYNNEYLGRQHFNRQLLTNVYQNAQQTRQSINAALKV